MMPDPVTGALKPAQDGTALLEAIPGLEKHCTIEVFHLFNIDSSNMQPSHWTTIARKIQELYDAYDGFVVAQGTDTMAFSASAVSFALQNTGKPVVFTGSIVPMSELGADGRNNLIYACFVAGMNIAEVCIVFGNKIVRANRAVKNHESFVDVFHSPNFPLLGEIERPIRLFDWARKRHDGGVRVQAEFDSNIELIRLFPGMALETITNAIERGVRGIVIQGFGPGNIPSADGKLLAILKDAVTRGVVVVISSQMEKSVTNLHSYEVGYKAMEAGVLSAGDMTNEATITKLMWALGQTDDATQVAKIVSANNAGERTAE